jgi:hypothetical protein
MAVKTVTTTAAEIGRGNGAGSSSPTWAVIQNLGAATVYVDTVDTVTADTAATGGLQIDAGGELSFPLWGTAKLYAVCASGTVTIAINDSAIE